jgi:hypothetical protein
MVTLIQRQIVPFSYVDGTVHAGLTDGGTLTVQGLVGVRVDLTTVPSQVSVELATPNELFGAGWINWGTGGMVTASEYITAAAFLSAPRDASLFTELNYSLKPGVIATITELQREP